MSHLVTIAGGHSNVSLPNGLRYGGSDQVLLSDAEYSLLTASFKSAYLSSDVAQGGSGGAVSSVFTRTGAVTAQSGDYTAAQVGALSSGTAVTIAQGGTGQVTQQAALDALAGAVTSGRVLRGNGTHVALAALQAGDVPTLNQSTTGNAATATNLAGGATVPAYLAPHVVTLTDGSSVPVDASLGNVFDWPLGAGSHTLAAPTNPVNGQLMKVRIAYSGAFTPLFDAIYHFGADGQPTWTAANAKVDEVAFEYSSSAAAWLCQGWKLGFL